MLIIEKKYNYDYFNHKNIANLFDNNKIFLIFILKKINYYIMTLIEN